MVTQSVPVGEASPSMPDPEGGGKAETLLVHGTAVQFCGKGILLLGPSRSGKSDLALCLIEAGATLIADDQVRLTHVDDRLHAAPPDRLQGLIALRGIGIMRVAYEKGALDLAVDLLPLDKILDPLPEPATACWLGVRLPKIWLDARTPSAVARIKMALLAERVF